MSKENYYTDIDEIPLYAYRKAIAGDFTYLRLDRQQGTEEEDTEAWVLLYDSYIAAFGMGDKQEQFSELQLQLIEVNLLFAETGDRFLINEINALAEELNRLLDATDKGSLADAVAYVMNYKRMVIDERNISAGSFLRLLDLVTKEIKQNGKAGQE